MLSNFLARRGRLAIWLIGLCAVAALLAGGNLSSVGAQPNAAPHGLGPQPPIQPTPIPRSPYNALSPLGNLNLQYGFTLALREHDLRLAQDGFQWAEFEVDWGSSEPTRGNYNWGNVDNIVDAAASAGIGVIFRVDQSPAWANGRGSNGWYPPQNPRDFGNFAGALAAHVRGRLSVAPVYEIWNEPNISDNWGGACPDPAAYTALVKAAFPAIKSADSRARLLAGAVTTVGALPAAEIPAVCAVDDLTFLQGMYDAGIQGYYDALSTHPYGFGDVPEADPRTPGRTLVFRRAELQREVMLANNDAAHHIWITETGWAIDPNYLGNCRTTCPNCYDWYFIWSPQQQADNLVRAFNWSRSYWDWADTIVVFNFDYNESWTDPCFPFNFFAVLDRPAEAALLNNRLHPPPTYTPVPVDYPPVVSNARLNPAYFYHSGGPLTVQIDASDGDTSPVVSASMVVTYPDSSIQTVPMTLLSGTGASGTWQGVFQVPDPSDGNTQTYTIRACAVEDSPPGRVVCAPEVPFTVYMTRFIDVPADFWAYQPIEYLAAQGIISGYNDHTFRPNNNATRGQFSKMIVAAEGWPIVTPTVPSFIDVPPANGFYGVIETAYAHGIISGYSDHTFRPNNAITRGQIAKLITLGEGWPLNPPPTPTFVDVPPGSPFYAYVEAVAARGVVSGYSDHTFRPNTEATRAQLSKMLYLAISLRPTPTPTATPEVTETPTPPAGTATTTPATGTATPTATGTPPTATRTATGTPLTATRTVTATTTAAAGLQPHK